MGSSSSGHQEEDDGGRPPDSSLPDIDLVCFSLIVDDIVYPDGWTSMAQVGGGGPQVLWGYAAAAAAISGDASPSPPPSIALAAGVGERFAETTPEVAEWLAGPCLGADLSGLRPIPGLETPRAWQILERDGRRTQVWRCAEGAPLYEQLRPPWASLPERLRKQARSYHIGLHAAYPPRSLLRELRRAVDDGGGGGGKSGGLVSAETYTACDAPLSRADLSALLAPLDIFSPNEDEAASMLGVSLPPLEATLPPSQADDDREEQEQRRAALVERLLLEPLLDAAEAGSERGRGLTVTLRRGQRGAMARCSSDSCGSVSVPAATDLSVVDPVGCGNAFCGAFLAAMHRDPADLRGAVAWGCAAGGTMAEHEGVPRLPLSALAPVVGRRARALMGVRARACACAGRPGVAIGVPRRL